MPKQILESSARQQILTVLFALAPDAAMTAATIKAGVVANGIEKGKVHVHSHLNAYMTAKTPLVEKAEGGYRLTEAGRKRYVEAREELKANAAPSTPAPTPEGAPAPAPELAAVA